MSLTVSEYRVNLGDLFSGPLDLLLYLVRRNELDILDLPIARIAAEFQRYIEVLEFLDLDLVGDFLVMASTLAEIKSRLALPRPEEEPVESEEADAGPTEDPRSDLVRRLLEYKRFRDAAKALEERAEQWQRRFPRLARERPSQGPDPSADRIKEVELWDLVSALARVLERKVLEEEARIRYDETPLAVYMQQVAERVRREGRVAFSSLFEDVNRRSKIIGIFLAVLELVRHQGFRAEQPEEFGEIWILPPDPSRPHSPESGSPDTQPAASPSASFASESTDRPLGTPADSQSDSPGTSDRPGPTASPN